MSDLSHDAVDDGFHEIQLSGKQLVFVFIAFTCVSVVIFLCGVFVGRGVRAARGEDAVEIAASAPTTPTPAADAASPPAEPPAPPPETPDALSYQKRLQGQTPAPETLKKPAAEPQPPAAGPPPAAAEPVSPPPPAARKAAAPPTQATSARPGRWYVQVFATKDAGVAERLVTRLAGKGYPAYLLPPAADEVQAYYRVRVGRYDDHNEAEAIKTRIAKEEQFRPYIDSR